MGGSAAIGISRDLPVPERLLLTPAHRAARLSICQSRVYKFMSCGQVEFNHIGPEQMDLIAGLVDFVQQLRCPVTILRRPGTDSETALGERHEDGDGELGTRTCGKDLAGRRSKDEPNEVWPTVPLCVGDMASKPSRTRVVPGWSLCTPVPKRYVDGSGPVTGARIRQGHHAGRTPAPSAVDQARSWAERTASEQGLPGKVIEQSVLQDVAVLLGSDSGPPGRSDPRRVEDVAASDGGANGDGFQESRDDRSLSGRSEGVPLAS